MGDALGTSSGIQAQLLPAVRPHATPRASRQVNGPSAEWPVSLSPCEAHEAWSQDLSWTTPCSQKCLACPGQGQCPLQKQAGVSPCTSRHSPPPHTQHKPGPHAPMPWPPRTPLPIPDPRLLLWSQPKQELHGVTQGDGVGGEGPLGRGHVSWHGSRELGAGQEPRNQGRSESVG